MIFIPKKKKSEKSEIEILEIKIEKSQIFG